MRLRPCFINCSFEQSATSYQLVAAGVTNYKFKKFRKDCDRSMKTLIVKFVILLHALDFEVQGGPEMRTRLLEATNRVAEQTEALKFLKRLPIMFLLLRVLVLFSRN